MAKRLYVSAAEPYSGKVVVSLGVMGILERTISRIAFFRPVGRACRLPGEEVPVFDRDAHLMREVFRLDAPPERMVGATSEEAAAMLADGRADALYEQVLARYQRLEEDADFVLVEGTDFLSAASVAEDDFNSNVARDLNAPVALVVDGSPGDLEQMHAKAKVGLEAFQSKGCEVLAVAFNKVPPAQLEEVRTVLGARMRDAGVPRVAVLPMEPKLAMPRMDEIVAQLGGEVLFGHRHMHNKVGKTIIASGSVATIIPLLEPGVLLVAHVDRHDVIFMALTSLMSPASPNIAGIVLTGTNPIAEPVMALVEGLRGPRIPIVRSNKNTFETAVELTRVHADLTPNSQRELEIARQMFERAMDIEGFVREIEGSTPHQMTPKRFKFELARRARRERKHIVLPEGKDERILKAADALLRLGVVELTLLGRPADLRNRADQLGLDIAAAHLVDPYDCEWTEELAGVYHRARQHTGVTLEIARETVLEPPVFGTLMVHTGRADGMVAGATCSTATTIRPALQLIKTKRGSSLVSSVFFMCLADRVLVYGDCAVIPTRPRCSSPRSPSRAPTPRRLSGSSPASRCSPTRPASPARAPTSTR
ncbi:MAG: phosphate acetyltransferase [Sandaracinaceae bacterium]